MELFGLRDLLDRVYINKWIELASGGILRENTHYQILFMEVDY